MELPSKGIKDSDLCVQICSEKAFLLSSNSLMK